MPPGGLSWGALFVRFAWVTRGPLVTLAWVTPEPRVTFAGVSPGHPGAPGHVCWGQSWALRHAPLPAPLGGLAAAAGDATASLSPPPCHSTLQRRAGSRAAPRSRPHQTRPPRASPPPHGHAWLRQRGAPRPPRSPERPPPSTARSPRSPRTPTPSPPAPRCGYLCGGGRGPRGKATPPPLFPGMRGPSDAQHAAATFRATLMTLAQPTPFSPESATSF